MFLPRLESRFDGYSVDTVCSGYSVDSCAACAMPSVDASVAAVCRRPSLIFGVIASLFFGLLFLVSGCAGPGREVTWLSDATLEHYRDRELHISNPVDSSPARPRESWKRPPRTITAPTEDEIRDLSLADALKLALENNSVIRTRGGFLSPGNAVLSSPDRVASIWDPAIQESGVLFGGRGVTAALAAFDPEFTTTMVWRRNETPQNNAFLAGGIGSGGSLVGEMGDFTSMLRKQMGYGASLSVGHDWSYFGSNIPSSYNLYNSTYTGNVNLRYRQPLLAGSGTEFTQIAGPVTQQFRGLSGVSQGVVIARINNDLTLRQFEQSAINLVKDVEDQYWDLYLAYRKWDAAVMARNSAQKSWRDTKVILDGGGKEGFTNSDEPLARDRYYQTRAQSEAALASLYRTETALRRLLGLPVSDGTVLRPSDEPVTARFEPNWEASLVEALTHRVELRRQRWSVQSLSLQLKAAESLIRPRLDLVGGYQVNALGDNLFSSDRSSPYSSGYRGLSHADHTGWNLGFEFTLPLGMRSANAQVKNLELRLAKSRAVLDAQESEISHELSDAIQQLAAQEAATRSNLNRRAAAQERVRQFEIEVFNAGTKTLDDLLRAQVSRADAEVAYYTSLVAYNQALANLHFRTGGLLAVNNVQLAESEWTPDAYRDALRRAWQRSHGLSADGLLEAQPTPFASPGPLSQPESAIEIPAVDDPPSPSTAIPIPERSESTVSPVDDSREIVPSTFRKLTDRLGEGTRSLKGQSRDLPTTPAEATDDRPDEPEIQEAAPRASKLSTTLRKLTDRLRVRTQSQKNTSGDLPASPSASTDSANRGTSTSRISESYQKLVDRLREQTRRIKAARRSDPAVSPDDTTTEPEIQEASAPASKFSGTYRKLIESLRGGIRRSGDNSQSTSVQEDSTDDQEMAPSRSSKLSGTYKTLVERLREGRKRFQNRSVPVSEDSPDPDTMGLPAVAEPPSRPIVPSSRQRLVHSIWKSKQAGEIPTGVTAPPPKPRILQSTFSDDDTASPGSEDDEFQLPR